MSRFLILFNALEPMSDFMARSTAEERQAGLEAWNKWRIETENIIKFEFGAVIEAVQRITEKGTAECENKAANYAFAEAESKDYLAQALQNHPHLNRANTSIDVLEILPMPSR